MSYLTTRKYKRTSNAYYGEAMHISSKKISDYQGLGRMERRKAENRDFRAEGTLYNSIMVGMPLYSCQSQQDT